MCNFRRIPLEIHISYHLAVLDFVTSKMPQPEVRIHFPNYLLNWPFPRSQNPHYLEAKSASSKWLESFHPFDEKSQKAFNLCDFSKFILSSTQTVADRQKACWARLHTHQLTEVRGITVLVHGKISIMSLFSATSRWLRLDKPFLSFRRIFRLGR